MTINELKESLLIDENRQSNLLRLTGGSPFNYKCWNNFTKRNLVMKFVLKFLKNGPESTTTRPGLSPVRVVSLNC